MSPAQVATVRADPKLNPLLHFFSNFQMITATKK